MTWQSAAHAKFSVFLISLRTFTHLQCDSRVDFSSDLETVEKITELKMEAKMWLVVVYCLVGISQSIVLGSPNLAVAPLSRIAFGSCANQSAPQPIWDAISRFNPHLFIWLGDNIYADEKLAAKIIGKERTVGPWKNTQRFLPVSDKEMKFKYDQAKTNPGYAWLRSKTQVIGTWDDHDYGLNDAGKEYPNKAISQKLMLDFLDEASNSPRRKQAGVYASYLFGPVGKQIKVILLDTRYHRDSLFSNGEMLGETQWTWLEKELKGNGAQITIIASSIQVVSNFSAVVQPLFHVESWTHFPKERDRLFKLIADSNQTGVIFISGDIHFGEITRYDCGVGYPLYDITSSGLTQAVEYAVPPSMSFLVRVAALLTPSTMRVFGKHCRYKSCVYGKPNFGAIQIDWNANPVVIKVEVRDVHGEPVMDAHILLSELQNGVLRKTNLKVGEIRHHCSLEMDLPWRVRYRLAATFYGMIAVILFLALALLVVLAMAVYKFFLQKAKTE
ncbi:uncharacterized protein LOC131042706 isoform X2 [Cryptomeria japonica]|uniref:uncharacterized protein LOC131042706 isoform X2 n=1 Tax=Cryptomeria japonica TaxID=3369 RepID=UPI0027DA0036|nr:uncharacterized protein LOC131042706 isoform X2 [Cryptomeria japonica]